MKYNTSARTCDKLAPRFPSLKSSLLVACVLLGGVGSTAWAQNRPLLSDVAKQNAGRQIQALAGDKGQRTKAQQKLDSQLIFAAREQATGVILAATPKLRHGLKNEADGRIKVNIRGTVGAGLLAAISAAGGTVIISFPASHVVEAVVPLQNVELLAARSDVIFIGLPSGASKNTGSVDTQGDTTHRAIQARANFAITGAGVKVGVLSDSSDNTNGALAAAYLSGDIDPANFTILPGQAGTGEGEGLAMCEIVHDIAPQAPLYFATGSSGEYQMAANILTLAQDGCQVIIDDISYFDEPPFQDGPIAQAVNTVSAQGIVYFSSARNSGNEDSGTSSTWEGDFVDGGNWAGLFNGTNRSGRLLAFAPGVVANAINPGGYDYRADLFWSDPLGGATDDYDLYMLDPSGNVVFAANTTQNGTQDPYEHIDDANQFGPGYFLVVTLHSGAGRFIHLDFGRGVLSTSTGGSVRGHNASGAANAFSVAAAPAAAAQSLGGPSGPFPNAFGSTNHVETFSSDGPRRIFFNANGTPITAGNFGSTGGQVLQKPDLTAADGVATTLPPNSGLNAFFGTSAAAPHAGAIAALLLSYRPNLTPAQIRTALMSSAIDILASGWDRDSGAGIVMADSALNSVDNTPPIVAVTGPGNGGAVALFTSISGTASDVGSGLKGNQIHFTLNNNGVFWSGAYWTNTATTDPSILLTGNVVNGAWIFSSVPTGQNQPQGTYYVSAYAQDNAGNVSSAQAGVTSTSFIVSTTPPTVAVTFPVNGSTIDSQLFGNWFQGTASGNLGIPVSLSLYIRRNSDNLYWTGSGWGSEANGFIPSVYTSGTHSWQGTGNLPTPGSGLLNGTYHFIAIAVDAAGSQQQVDSVVSVNYHPVYTFTAGSYDDANPANWNMLWADPENWDRGAVPTPDADVVINDFAPDNTSLTNIQLYRLDLSVGGLTTLGMMITNLNISSGSLIGDVITLPSNGVFNWSGGTLGGVCNVPAGAVVNVTGTADKTLLLGTINNSGIVNWNNGNIVASYDSVVTNNGSFIIQGTNLFTEDGTYYGYGYPLPVFVNNGLLEKTNASGIATFDSANGGCNFIQNGTLDVETGVLSSLAQITVNGGAVFSGGGETRLDAGTMVMNGTNTLQAGATVELAGGTWSGRGLLGGSGTFVWSGGIISGTNIIGENANLSVTGAGEKTLTVGNLINLGAGTWRGTGGINCSFGSTLENDGTFIVQNSSALYTDGSYYGYGYPQALFINNRTFVKTNSPDITSFPLDSGGVAFNNNGTVTVQSGALDLGGGGVSTNATFAVATGLLVDFTAGNFFCNGTLTLTGAGTNRVNGATMTFDNGTNALSGGDTFEIAAGAIAGASVVAGTGTVNWSGGTISAVILVQTNIAMNLTTTNDKTFLLGTLVNNGTLKWSSGDIIASYGSAITNNTTFVIEGPGLFYDDGNYYGYGYPTPVFANNGLLQKMTSSGVTAFAPDNGSWFLDQNGVITVAAGVLSSQGAFNINAGATFGGAGETRVDAGTMVATGNITIQAGATVELANGVLSGVNVFGGAGTFIWSGGTIVGTSTVGAGANLMISGAAEKTLSAGTLVNSGQGIWTGTGAVNCSYNSVFQNNGTFIAENNSSFYTDGAFYGYGYPLPLFINDGIFRKVGTTGTTIFPPDNGGVSFANNGTVDLETGVLAINSAYALSGSPRLDVVLGGLAPGTEYSEETFGNPAALGGILSVTLTNGFSPTNGESFAIINYGAETGQFSSQLLPKLPNNLAWQVNYGAKAVTLNVIRPQTLTNPTLLANGHFEFTLVGPSATSATIQTSTNLVDWVPAETNAPFSGVLLFDDPRVAGYPMQFYRVLIAP